MLAWTGTDPNHSLNVMSLNWRTLKPITKTILPQFRSITGPSLMRDPNPLAQTTQLLLSRADSSPLHRIRFATSTDEVHWTQPTTSPLGQWTAAAPSMIILDATNMPRYFVGWAGTDPEHSRNGCYTASFPQWPLDNAQTTFGDWAFGEPALADSLVGRQIVMAWTGTDPRHRLNLALVGV